MLFNTIENVGYHLRNNALIRAEYRFGCLLSTHRVSFTAARLTIGEHRAIVSYKIESENIALRQTFEKFADERRGTRFIDSVLC